VVKSEDHLPPCYFQVKVQSLSHQVAAFWGFHRISASDCIGSGAAASGRAGAVYLPVIHELHVILLSIIHLPAYLL
jgi:hypothetical protein